MLSTITKFFQFLKWTNGKSSTAAKELIAEVKKMENCSTMIERRVFESSQYIDRILNDDLSKITV